MKQLIRITVAILMAFAFIAFCTDNGWMYFFGVCALAITAVITNIEEGRASQDAKRTSNNHNKR